MNEFQVLVDSDGWIALYLPNDALYEKAAAIYERLERQEKKLVTTSAVIEETVTVLSHRSGQALARQFFSALRRSNIPIIPIDESLRRKALDLFMEQKKRGTSFVDCSNVVVMKYFDIPKIFSFDKAYSKQFGIEAVA